MQLYTFHNPALIDRIARSLPTTDLLSNVPEEFRSGIRMAAILEHYEQTVPYHTPTTVQAEWRSEDTTRYLFDTEHATTDWLRHLAGFLDYLAEKEHEHG